MDTRSSSSFNSAEPWTNEKHLHYLNSMESSFVHAMFGNNNGRPLLRLDRYLPDTSDSTLDLTTHRRRRKHATATGGRAKKRFTRRRSYQPYNTSSQDQEVPQLESRRGCKDQLDPSDARSK